MKKKYRETETRQVSGFSDRDHGQHLQLDDPEQPTCQGLQQESQFVKIQTSELTATTKPNQPEQITHSSS